MSPARPARTSPAREADLVIAIGTRLSDFTTASKTAFQNPDVRFVNINVAEFDAFKHAGLPLIADARVALEQLEQALAGYHVEREYAQRRRRLEGRVGKRRPTASSACATVRPSARAKSSARVNRIAQTGGRRRERRRQPARRPAQALAHAARPAAITWSTATRAWDTRSPAAWA